MEFSPGQVVVHPHHGPSTVTGVIRRQVKGREVRYIQLDVHHSSLAIAVPEAMAAEVGVRPLLSPETIAEVFTILTSPSGKLEAQWSRRIKAQHELCRSGEVRTIAGVIRDLTRRDEDKGLSMGEKDLLKEARTPLVTELALCLQVTEEAAHTAVEAAVLEGVTPTWGTDNLPIAV